MNPAMRPKVTGDTFFLPDPEGAVYFRRNGGSFRMEGSMIDRWIDKLMPVFNGERTLAELTGGLPDAHRDRVFEIAGTLLEAGFVRDAALDLPHGLPDGIAAKFAPQIDFLDSFGGSGGFRFRKFRETPVLVAGSGQMLVSLVSALLEAGHPRFSVMDIGRADTAGAEARLKRIEELAAYARLEDPEVKVEAIGTGERMDGDWGETVRPFEWVLYAGGESGLPDFRALHEICRVKGKSLIPALTIGNAGLAGPVVTPGTDGCWESAWRRLQPDAVGKKQSDVSSPTAEGMLANAAVFEFFKAASGVDDYGLRGHLYVLDLETLEGSRHAFLPHPALRSPFVPVWKEAGRLERRDAADAETAGSEDPFALFNRLTSAHTGILHHWDEGDTWQLPLSQCLVQASDPRSPGPAGLLAEMTCGGLTHEEARREAGLAGVEAYVSAWAPHETLGIGAGMSRPEAVCRALYHGLKAQLPNRKRGGPRPAGMTADCAGLAQDEKSAFYLRSLTTLKGEPEALIGERLCGFPVIWLRTGNHWFAGVGFDRTDAFRDALLEAVLAAQNEGSPYETIKCVPAFIRANYDETLAAALQDLRRQGFGLLVSDLAAEPFLRESFGGVCGVALRREVPA